MARTKIESVTNEVHCTDKNVHECKGYNTPQFITEFPDKGWTKNSINGLLVKLRELGGTV